MHTGISSGTLNFTFSSVTIAVPMRELVLDVLENGGTGIPTTIGGQGTPACVFGIAPALDTPIQLGATLCGQHIWSSILTIMRSR